MKIIDECNAKCDEAMAEAKAAGTWLPGLDSNRGLFKPIKDKYFKKLQELAAMIDEPDNP